MNLVIREGQDREEIQQICVPSCTFLVYRLVRYLSIKLQISGIRAPLTPLQLLTEPGLNFLSQILPLPLVLSFSPRPSPDEMMNQHPPPTTAFFPSLLRPYKLQSIPPTLRFCFQKTFKSPISLHFVALHHPFPIHPFDPKSEIDHASRYVHTIQRFF